MQLAPRHIMLFATLALGSFALGAATTRLRASAPQLAPRMVQAPPVSGGDSSVPSASTVTFPAGGDTVAPTF